MKPQRPQKRSVSPFGVAVAPAARPFARLEEAIAAVYPAPAAGTKPQLKSIEDAAFLSKIFDKLADAPAYDAPELDTLCQFLLRFHETLNQAGLEAVLWESMQDLFDRKTELFMIDNVEEDKFVVLFAKERDALVGRYFAPMTESQPGMFSGFVTRWMESDNPDRILHFLDFCAGSNNPTFEHFLLFAHPAFARIVKNKNGLRALFEKAQSLTAKLSSPAWEQQTRKALGI